MKKINMKTKLLKITAILLILAGSFSCEEKEDKIEEKAGVAPTSIEQIVDVFELKYGEVKECVYEGQSFKFSIADIDDQRICPVQTGSEELILNETKKIHVYMQVESGKRNIRLKLSSKHLLKPIDYGPFGVTRLWNMLEWWQSDGYINEYGSFEAAFSSFGGTQIENSSYSIFIADALPYCKQELYGNVYHVFLILTK
ncbi:hypothetical protein FACS1894178_8390 [Bacteroidia bacterium]|nr:hypothetical protein FACS1894178_8390 [Bacteroidia bacterium]